MNIISVLKLKISAQFSYYLPFLCRLPFWQRHLIFPVSSKSWHALEELFLGFFTFIYFIELKFIVVENSVCHSLPLYVSYHSKVKLFVKVFYDLLTQFFFFAEEADNKLTLVQRIKSAFGRSTNKDQS